MAEGDATLSASTSSNREGGSSLCEECKSKPSKYKCPACSLRSCSLNCVNAHKRHSGCTGKRKHIQLVSLSQFNDSILLSDYNLLEEVKRMAESAQRFRKKLCPYTHAYFRFPFHLKSLRTAASSRRTKIMFLPTGMTKRENNQTRYDKRVNENSKLSTILENHLQPSPWKNQLQNFCEQLDSLKFFVRAYPKGATSPFHELDSRLPIRELFYNLVFVEYPVIYVVLPSQTPNFQVVKTAKPTSHNPEDTNTEKNDLASHEGVSFRVEEIEDDDNSCNPRVLDLLKVSTSSPRREVDSQNLHNYFTDLMGKHEFGNGPNSSSQAEEIAVSKGLEFDFEQDLIDTYSNIMAQINPDDFLDWEGDFSKGVEELEEGEIME
ncbi:box C/D snoRNA protein 1-like isoform X2 [Cucurbita pepo subsp. pepo]|uniref:box C/D snoRNA protein 1-like isoform X2 n=1 Tax=Cucurbita pepo subsp. pepo TaxID=3664 RepID=UPI000C9D5420|nr:box C/D snoRNA protein 1-like isoform X2 [Cucurbita pepo subsp. pepo]